MGSSIYFSIPLVGAVIGWATNVLAIRMLFRPRLPWRLGWFHLQGVIPRRKTALAGSVAEIFERELLSNEELIHRLQGLSLEGYLEPVLETHMQAFLDRVVARMPMAKMFLSDALRGSIADQLKTEMISALPQVQLAMGRSLGEQFDLRALIEEKVRGFSEHRLESIILAVAKRELKTIEWLGGLLGFLIGLVQVGIMAYF